MTWLNGSSTVSVWTYRYEGAGRLASVLTSFGSWTTYVYDREGKLVRVLNSNGTSLTNVAASFAQGNITVSNNPLDLAINGQGFFRVDTNGAVAYTRNGQFQLDKDGYAAQQGSAYGFKLENFLNMWGMPCWAPPYGNLSSYDMNTGKLNWKKPFGVVQKWGFYMPDSWGSITIGAPAITEDDALDHLVRRYLGAFGPAAVSNVARWAGVHTHTLEPVPARLALRRFRDEAGMELLDVPRAPLPDPDTPAPVRFLPHFDSCLLVHARRTGLVPEEYLTRMFHTRNPFSVGAVLVDGRVAGAWSHRDGRIVVDAYEPLPLQVEEERERLEAFHA